MLDKKLLVRKNLSIKECLNILNDCGRKCLLVVNKNYKLLGTLSDGDIRKAISRGVNINEKINNYFNKKPFFLLESSIENKNLKDLFIKFMIDLIPVVKPNKIIVDILFLQDILKRDSVYSYKFKYNIPVIIMAGGRGTRLQPFTNVLPKPLLPINDKTIIEIILENFKKYHFNNFNFLVNYKSLILKAYLTELKSKFKIKFYQEKRELGTVGGLSLIRGKVKENFILSNCDIVVKCDFNDLVDFHVKSKSMITVVVVTKQFVLPYGNCVLYKNGELRKIEEKRKIDSLVNTGVYVMNKKIIDLIKISKKLDFDELIFIANSKKMKISVFPIYEKSWLDVGQWSEYKKNFEKMN